MRRVLAGAALVFTGLLLGGGPASAAAAPVPVTLTINTQSPEVWFSVNVAGAAAPTPTKLADASGEHAADVAVKVCGCPANVHAEQLEVGLTGSTWCVHVSNLQAGHAVSGTLANSGTSLALTVKRKDGPAFPVFWSVFALLVAAIISVLSSTYVPALTSRMRLSLYKRDGGITGLGAWVKAAAADGVMADDDIVARAQWARRYAAKQVMAVRVLLGRAVGAPDLSVPPDSPLWQACQTESIRPATDVSREDVLTDAGVRAIKAADLLKALTAANTAIHDFTSSANEVIAALTVPDEVQQATRARDNALRGRHDLTEENVPLFVTTLSGTAESMRRNFQAGHLELLAVSRLVAAATGGPAAASAAAEVVTSVKAALEPAAVYVPSVLLALIIMAGAVATVFSAQYLANPAFGTTADYWALGLSAYGSAQATAIAAALLLIRPPKPWYG